MRNCVALQLNQNVHCGSCATLQKLKNLNCAFCAALVKVEKIVALLIERYLCPPLSISKRQNVVYALRLQVHSDFLITVYIKTSGLPIKIVTRDAATWCMK